MEATGEEVKGATAGFTCFHCPLVASAEAKPLRQSQAAIKRTAMPSQRTITCGDYPFTAIASISTFASRGSFATCTHARAGGFCGKNFP